jgi:hypothetical protein
MKLTTLPSRRPEAVTAVDIITETGVVVGEAYREVDGFYVFVPNELRGFWAGWMLRAVSDVLDNLNLEHHLHMDLELRRAVCRERRT